MMFNRTRGSDESEQARDALETTRTELEAERLRLEQERERLERLQEELEQRQDEMDDRAEEIEDLEDEIEELEGPEEVREVLDIVSARIPGIMKDVQSAIYSTEALERMAEALGAFYKKLIESGIPERQASELTMFQQTRLAELSDGRRIHIRPPRAPRPPKGPRPGRWSTRITRDGTETIIRTTRDQDGEKE